MIAMIRHQVRSPSRRIAAGLTTKRTIVASIRSATATSKPICWDETSSPAAKPAKPTMLVSAAPVISRAVDPTPKSRPQRRRPSAVVSATPVRQRPAAVAQVLALAAASEVQLPGVAGGGVEVDGRVVPAQVTAQLVDPQEQVGVGGMP
jgi:hypothetical protein